MKGTNKANISGEIQIPRKEQIRQIFVEAQNSHWTPLATVGSPSLRHHILIFLLCYRCCVHTSSNCIVFHFPNCHLVHMSCGNSNILFANTWVEFVMKFCPVWTYFELEILNNRPKNNLNNLSYPPDALSVWISKTDGWTFGAEIDVFFNQILGRNRPCS